MNVERSEAEASAARVESLIADLDHASAFPGELEGEVEVIQTHASVVFLVGDRVFKVKKPVDLGFLDYSDPVQRRAYCAREVEINRPWAPGVYLGVLVLRRVDGRWRFASPAGAKGEEDERPGPDVEWAVHMRRLPDGATLQSRLHEGRLEPRALRRVARRVAEFHARAGERNAARLHADPERVAENCRDNFPPLWHLMGASMEDLLRRLQAATEAELDRVAGLLAQRCEQGIPRDGHGDLRLEHVYLLDASSPPDDLVIVDRIEFNDRFRLGDPALDLSFLVMELLAAGRRDLAQVLEHAYRECSGDRDLPRLLPLFVAYRATVRAKVLALRGAEAEVPAPARQRARLEAEARVRLALSTLEPPEQRPALVLVSGLPGTGKSSVAEVVAGRGAMRWIRSDAVRKSLVGLAPTDPAAAAPGAGIYAPEMTERTYARCLELAREELRAGGRVVVDATFKERDRRESFADLAVQLGVPMFVLGCELEAERVRERLAQRRGDPSDADWRIYEASRRHWEPFEADEPVHRVDTSAARAITRASVEALLVDLGLAGP